ncbi:sulfite exporter TauE/SafE family protein [bacterium]|nr:sulfite exporter TauE/SafE family protein [bacterium]
MPEQWILLLVVGLIAGVLSGMFGIGGGVIIVPALTLFLGFEIIEATSTSLAALLLPVGIFAVIQYRRAGLLNIRSAALVAVGLLVTSWLGAWLAISLPADTLKRVYGVFLLYVSWRMMEPRKAYAEQIAQRQAVAAAGGGTVSAQAPTQEETPQLPDAPWYVILVVGLVAGVASGMFGIGGGAVIVPALVVFLAYPQKLAVGTSLGGAAAASEPARCAGLR